MSDEALEDPLDDSIAMRTFASIDLAVENAPDATTLLKFRRLLREHDLTRKVFDEIGIPVGDAMIIEALTGNLGKSRDTQMYLTKKGNAWHFSMKAQVGIDAESDLVHGVVGTAAPMDRMCRRLISCCTVMSRKRSATRATSDKRDEIEGRVGEMA
ncbi:hypothetical protein LMG29542_08449 [Paraburkholderia humisilvae]|uniref:Transposase InsH N-terminal domain-containing protein n=1 Tax=Paraburkholderia humisilvae TaxID=627669 RepID=A0A6J5FC84_9BURK|nr:hypothetical protein LMG29542_08449 [Paraburkholderia humisilvae]